MRINGLDKLLGTAIVADAVLNEGQGIKKVAPGCGCYVIFLLVVFITPFAWLYMKIFH